MRSPRSCILVEKQRPLSRSQERNTSAPGQGLKPHRMVSQHGEESRTFNAAITLDTSRDNPPNVSVIIPTFRRPKTLERTIQSLSLVSYEGSFEVIIVDDDFGSGIATLEPPYECPASRMTLRFLRQQNLGAARARNQGAKAAQGELLIFLDDDMLVEADHLDRHIYHLSNPRARTIVNGRWEFAPEVRDELETSAFGRFRIWLEDWFKDGIEMKPLGDGLWEPNLLTACNLGIRRDHFLELGGFDETFPLAGYEDQDFTIRAHKAGFLFIYDPAIALRHLDRRTSLSAFSERVRQGAFTAGLMAKKHPDEFAQRPLVKENAPISRLDSPRTILKKLMKRLGASHPGRSLQRRYISFLERFAPNSSALRDAYWKWCGTWIFLGIREGLRTTFPTRD